MTSKIKSHVFKVKHKLILRFGANQASKWIENGVKKSSLNSRWKVGAGMETRTVPPWGRSQHDGQSYFVSNPMLVTLWLRQFWEIDCRIIMLSDFAMWRIGHQYLKVVTNIKSHQNLSPTSMSPTEFETDSLDNTEL